MGSSPAPPTSPVVRVVLLHTELGVERIFGNYYVYPYPGKDGKGALNKMKIESVKMDS